MSFETGTKTEKFQCEKCQLIEIEKENFLFSIIDWIDWIFHTEIFRLLVSDDIKLTKQNVPRRS